MLDGNLSVRMLLWIGDTVPVPASPDVMNAVTDVQVTNDSKSSDGFQMTFTLGKDKALDFSLLRSGALDPFKRVVVGVLMGLTPEVLIDGVITHHQFNPSNEPGRSTLTVTGLDVSAMLNLEEVNKEFKNMPDSVIVQTILAQHSMYGLVPDATPTTNVPIEVQQTVHQCDTDLNFIKHLAQENGFVFYVEPVTVGVNKAHWGPESRLGLPAPGLTMDLGHANNIKSLSFSFDALAPVGTQGSVVEPNSKASIPIPPLPSFRVPPLAARPATARRTVLMRDTANENAGRGATSALAAAMNTPDAVTGSGELDTVRYGHVLRARRLVGVRGAGFSYDGIYYVEKVTHKLKVGEYTQSFSLTREGIGATVPAIPT